jgi:hypothetical protein
MKDIPLSEAIVAARGCSRNSYPKVVKVFRNPPDARGILKFEYTCGADHSGFRALTESEQLLEIFLAKWVLIVSFGMPEKIVHEALLAIPEYRREMKRLNGRSWPEAVDRFVLESFYWG